MNKVGIVILNYLNYKDTIDCIKSLEIDLYEDKEIVIVDNNSKNESYEILKKLYQKENNIHVIQNNINLGFARGNNEGILYARNKLGCNHILLLNSDTIITCDNFISNFVNAYKNGIGLIGCRIIDLNGKEQNPHRLDINDKIIKSILYKLKNNKKTIIDRLCQSKFYSIIRETSLLKQVRIKKDKNKVKNNICSLDLVLHGSCIMLTRDYFKYYPYLYPQTFLYGEECILTILTRKVDLKKLFINNIYINHKEGQSSKLSFGNKDNVKRKYSIDSYTKCYELFDMSYNEILTEYFSE